MLELIKIIEYRDTNRPIKIVRKKMVDDGNNQRLDQEEVETLNYSEVMDGWKQEVKKIIPVNYKLEILPIRFTFT